MGRRLMAEQRKRISGDATLLAESARAPPTLRLRDSQRVHRHWGPKVISVFLFSPKFGFWPVTLPLINSKSSTAFDAGPSQSAPRVSSARRTQTSGSPGPFHHILSVTRQYFFTVAGSAMTVALAASAR